MPRRNTYPWARIVADARAHDGWLLPPELTAVPVRVALGIRLLRHPDLIVDDGYLEPQIAADWRDEDGRKIATIYVRFVRYAETTQPPSGAERRQ